MSAALQLVKNLSCHTKRQSTNFCAVPNRHYDDISHDLQPRDKTTYDQLYRLSYGWGTDTAWVSVDRLAERVCVSRNTLRAALASLEAKNKIHVLSRDDRGLVIKVHPLFEDDSPACVTTQEEKDFKEKPLEALPTKKEVPPPQKKVSHPSKSDSRGSEIAPIIKTELKKEAKEHTNVCVDDDGPLISTKNFEPIQLSPEHVHPLACLTDKAILASHKIADRWTVLRVVFTLIINYLGNKVAIANPVALLLWAIKNKNTFVCATDKEIKNAIVKGLGNVWSWLITPEEKELWAPDKIDINAYIKWLQSEDHTLKEIWEQWSVFCPALSKTHSLLFFVNVRINPFYEQLKKVREMHGEYWHRD
jgi:hypothetical protein